MSFVGYLERRLAPGGYVRGWAVDRADPETPVRLTAFINGEPAGDFAADLPRGDLKELSGQRGFRLRIPARYGALERIEVDVRLAADGERLKQSPLVVSGRDLADAINAMRGRRDAGAVTFVLGMHRSGTSALTRVLSLLSFQLPEDLIPPTPGDNPTGFWEPAAVVAANERILAALGSHWIDSRRPGWDRLEDAARHALEDEIAGLAASWPAEWCAIKDPRLSVLLPIWRSALEPLGVPIRAILSLRHPTACAASLQARNGLPLEVGEVVWLRYLLEAEAATRTMPRAFVSYDALLRDWRAATAGVRDAFATPPLRSGQARKIDVFLDGRLRHHEPLACGLADAETAYAVLERGAPPDAWPLLDEMRDRLDRAEPYYGEHARLLPLVIRDLRKLELRLSKIQKTLRR